MPKHIPYTSQAFCIQVASFAHWQLNGPPFTEPEYILHKVRSGLAIFDSGEQACLLMLCAYWAGNSHVSLPVRLLCRGAETRLAASGL